MLNVAVIGVGMMGRHHVRILDELKNSNLTAISDINERRVKELARKYHVNPYTDYKEMLKEEDIDAVSIAVPTTLHARVAIDCIREGKHVLIEKPIASTVKDGEKIVDEARKHRVKLMVGHVERFNPIVQKLKRMIENNEFGDIHFIATTRIGPFPERMRDVGVVTDLATHDFDVIRFLTGREPKKIFATILLKRLSNGLKWFLIIYITPKLYK